jgi:hypothetical protein
MAGDEGGTKAELRTKPCRTKSHGLVGARVVELDDGATLPSAQEAGETLAQECGG